MKAKRRDKGVERERRTSGLNRKRDGDAMDKRWIEEEGGRLIERGGG